MMRALLPLVLLFSTSAFAAAPFKWPEALVKNLNSKTLRQAFCEKNVGFQAQGTCDYIAKEKGALDKKVKSARVEGATLFLVVGKRQVEIKTTSSPTQFEINRKVIDLKDYRDPVELVRALKATFPRVAASSRWVNFAYADDDQITLKAMSEASALMLAGTADRRWCAYAEKFIRECNINVSTSSDKQQWSNIYEKIVLEKPLDKRDVRWIEADAINFIVLAQQMRDVVVGLNRSDVQDALKRCPSFNVPPLKNAQEDFVRCDKILAGKKAISKMIPEMASKQQKDLAANLTKPEHIKTAERFRNEVVGWMIYISSNESEMKIPDALLNAPTQ